MTKIDLEIHELSAIYLALCSKSADLRRMISRNQGETLADADLKNYADRTSLLAKKVLSHLPPRSSLRTFKRAKSLEFKTKKRQSAS